MDRQTVLDAIESAFKAHPNVPREIGMAMFGRESNFDNYAKSGVGAEGLGQLMPDTARELGVTDVYDPYQNAEASLRYLSQMHDMFGDWSLALMAYNAGAGSVQQWLNQGIDLSNFDNIPFEETREYLKHIIGGGLTSGGLASASDRTDHYDIPNSYADQDNWQDRSGFWDKFTDSFLNQFYSNGTVAMLRNSLSQSWEDRALDYILGSQWKPNDDEIEYLKEQLGDDENRYNSVLLNAVSRDSFMKLIENAKEDQLRELRVDDRPIGMHSVGAVLGMIADPLNFVPLVGQEAIVSKALARMSPEIISAIGKSKLFQLAEIGATNGLINMADQENAKQYGGWTPNYGMAFALGAGAGVGFRILNDFFKGRPKGKAVREVEEQLNTTAEKALMESTDFKSNDNWVVSDKTLKHMEHHNINTVEELYEKAKANRKSKTYNLLKKDFEEANGAKLSISQFDKYLDIALKEKDFLGVKENSWLDYKRMREDIEKAFPELPPQKRNLQEIGKFLDTNRFLGDRHGLFLNSPSPTLNKFARVFLYDSRQRGANIGTSVETGVKVLEQPYQQMFHSINKAYKKFVFSGNFFNNKRKFLDQLTEAYLLKYEHKKDISHYGEHIAEAVDKLHEVREGILDDLLHAGIIDKTDFKNKGELWRRVDMIKLNTLRTKFNSDEAFKEFLTKYAKRAMRYDLLDNGTDSDKLAADFAEYIMDKSNYTGKVSDDKRIKSLMARIPMDTSKIMEMPNGEMFSFNTHLRDTNILSIAQSEVKRAMAEISMRNQGIDNPSKYLNELVEKAEQELNDLYAKGQLQMKDVKQQMGTLYDSIRDLTGITMEKDGGIREEKTNTRRLRDILMKASYATNGMNMGINQISETLNSMAINGARGLFHYIPAMHDLLHNLKYGDMISAKQLRHMKDTKLGIDLAEDLMFNPRINTAEMNARSISLSAKILGYVEDTMQGFGHITSALNQLQHLTNMAVSGIKADIIPDLMKWSRGEFNGTFNKNLFHEDNFRQAGITDVNKFKCDIKKYLDNLGKHETALTESIDKWQREDIYGYMKFLSFLDHASQRAILQGGVGNRNLHGDGFMSPIFFQFKEFTRMAINGHLMRMLNRGEREHAVMLLGGAISGGAIWAIRTRIYAESKYGNDESGKRKYLEETLTPENMLRAGFFRSSVLSGLSYINDGYEAITGASTIRTTVDRQQKSDDIAGRLAQVPVATSLNNIVGSGKSVLRLMTGSDMTREDFRNFNSLFPLDRYVPLQIFLAELKDSTYKSLPKRKDIDNK